MSACGFSKTINVLLGRVSETSVFENQYGYVRKFSPKRENFNENLLGFLFCLVPLLNIRVYVVLQDTAVQVVIMERACNQQCVKRRETTPVGDDSAPRGDDATEQRLPWPMKRPCRKLLEQRLSGDRRCGSAVEDLKSYCLDRNLPADFYRPVAGTCGGGGGKFRLTDLIGELHRVFAEDQINVEYIRYLMESYQSDPAEWLKYAKFNKFRYTRNLVDAGNGKFNLMVLCWGEGNGSSIHNHPDSDCMMKILAGQLTEVRFAWPDQNADDDNDQHQPMCEIGRTVLETESVCHINGWYSHTSRTYLLTDGTSPRGECRRDGHPYRSDILNTKNNRISRVIWDINLLRNNF